MLVFTWACVGCNYVCVYVCCTVLTMHRRALFCLHMFTTLFVSCILKCMLVCVHVCACVFPSFEERQCSTFHRGTESLLKQELKPGGHGSACSVNRSS